MRGPPTSHTLHLLRDSVATLTSHFCCGGAVGPGCPLVPVLADLLDFADILPLICWPEGQDRQPVEYSPTLLEQAQPLLVGSAAEVPIVLNHPQLGHLHHQGLLGAIRGEEPAHSQQTVFPSLLGDMAEESGIFPFQVVNHRSWGHGDIESTTQFCK